MSDRETIDIEEIMKEIREDIEKKGYCQEMLSFYNENPFETANIEKFSMNNLKGKVYRLNQSVPILYYREINQKGLKGFLKRILRKFLGFLIIPIVEEQNRFNEHTIRCVNQIMNYIEEHENKVK